MAIGVLQAARERGLRVPEDVAVVGIDDVEWSAHAIQRLTS
ncbi:MAG: LacI family transcriptional regulator, partial [Armatimonadetes bacterium]|nr:LacI family transcriptional regulator [Armatimonadota bacterium]